MRKKNRVYLHRGHRKGTQNTYFLANILLMNERGRMHMYHSLHATAPHSHPIVSPKCVTLVYHPSVSPKCVTLVYYPSVSSECPCQRTSLLTSISSRHTGVGHGMSSPL